MEGRATKKGVRSIRCEKHPEEKPVYSDIYDAYYCRKCNRWLERSCHDPKCYFCAKRPKKPLPADFVERL